MIQFNKYSLPEGDSDRMAAITARKYFWNVISHKEAKSLMPPSVPKNFFMRQETVCCLGYELASKLYSISEDDFRFYQGYSLKPPKNFLKTTGAAIYHPRDSGFFSVIENIIAAEFSAWVRGRALLIDTSYDWWGYEESFQELFPSAFKTISGGLNADGMRAVEFNGMRESIFNGPNEMLEDFYNFKIWKYQSVYDDLKNFYTKSLPISDSSCVMFIRGGDKLAVETIPTPPIFLERDLKEAAKRVDDLYVLSDEYALANLVNELNDDVMNITPKSCKGYVHAYGNKISCEQIVKNYLTLVDCRESLSCPSANLVNAAHWTKTKPLQSKHSFPVYRYALI
jgi:hypothetical protein